MTSQSHTGSCLCGAVACALDGPLRDVVACHCAMCRKTHGHFAAYTAVPKAANEAATSSGFSRSMSKTHTSAPLLFNSRAMARPIPLAPPVTTASFELKSMSISTMLT